ncbi:MAG: 30S ribosomal protein S15 [Patescibacteria group bacterium]|nr:30S ribosomal protein S15 [Patescibacteria group bacterium]
MLKTSKKSKIIKEYKVHEKDTGSSDVQAAILTKQVEELTKHLKKHPKDNHSRLGLLKMISKRRKLLDYLMNNDEKRYKKVIKKLGLKK